MQIFDEYVLSHAIRDLVSLRGRLRSNSNPEVGVYKTTQS
jgi:hypothetical protein